MVALVIAVVGTMVSPVEAGPKKRSKPLKFETAGTLTTANPLTLRRIGVTRSEFMESCAIPKTQGLDGYVIELPPDFKTISSEVNLTGVDVTGQPDLDMYYFDGSCEEVGYTATGSFSESGVMPKGVEYVLVTAFFGASAEFTFEAVELKS